MKTNEFKNHENQPSKYLMAMLQICKKKKNTYVFPIQKFIIYL